MVKFIVVTGAYPQMGQIKQFLLEFGVHPSLINNKLNSLQVNPIEEAFVLALSEKDTIIGLAEIMVQYKLTRSLSKVCHLQNIFVCHKLEKQQAKKLHEELQNFTISYCNGVLGCYKTVTCWDQGNKAMNSGVLNQKVSKYMQNFQGAQFKSRL